MTHSQTLLGEYAKHGSEAAFQELVTRYINFVYSTALWLVGGDTHLAEDIVQTVFINLAKKGQTLSGEVMLGGWLHQHTYHVATNVMRSERRRLCRERQATEMNALQDDSEANRQQIAPMLDEAITQLGTEDRMAILLRFFEQCDFRTIGSALGSNEDAARMRVARALEKLHAILTHRGATLTVAALGTALASVTTAPAGLAGSVATTALASAAAGVGIPTTLFKMIAMTKLKTGIISAVICTGVAIPLVLQHRTQAKFQEENRSLRQQMAQVASENERLSNLVMQVKSSQPVSQDQLHELLRLRGEVGVLMRQLAEKAKIQPSRQAIRSEQTVEQEEQPTPSQQLGIAKMNYAKHWVLAFQEYAQKNQGQMPAHFDHAGSFLSKNAPEETPSTTSQLEIVYQGSLIDLTNRQNIIVIREKEAWQSADGGWRRTYGFADGHAEIHHESTEGDLQAWEAQHLKLPSVPRQ